MLYNNYKSYSNYAGALGLGAAVDAYKYYSLTRTITEREKDTNMDQDTGLRRRVTRPVVRGRKKYSQRKVLSSAIECTTQQLGARSDVTPWTIFNRNLVSEFDPGRGGCLHIGKDSNTNMTPMHVYDLNYYAGFIEDNTASLNNQLIATNQNVNINSRAWWWHNQNFFSAIDFGNQSPRYFIKDPNTAAQDSKLSTKIFRNNIIVDMMLYGTSKMPTEFDVRIIKCIDPRMCPDYAMNLTNGNGFTDDITDLNEFRNAWSSLVMPYTTNPMLMGIEPGPKTRKRWFKTIVKKKVVIGETTSLESVPAVQIKLVAKLNQVTDYGWSHKDFQVEAGDYAYDEAGIAPNDAKENTRLQGKPHYNARYYLVVRALTPKDVSTQVAGTTVAGENTGTLDETVGVGINNTLNINFKGVSNTDYLPSYDLNVRTSFSNVVGI